jgi:hypothetical protein
MDWIRLEYLVAAVADTADSPSLSAVVATNVGNMGRRLYAAAGMGSSSASAV